MNAEADLYAVLGISRHASAAEIKSAYRGLSKREHPDKGGSSERFHAIKKAYDILSDPDRRQRYDATGIIEDVEPDNSMNAVLGLISEAFTAMMIASVSQKKNLKTMDLCGLLTAVLEEKRRMLREQIDQQKLGVAKMIAITGRFERRTKDKPNVLGDMVSAKLSELNKNIQIMSAHNREIDDAILLISDHSYAADIAETLRYAAMFGSGIVIIDPMS